MSQVFFAHNAAIIEATFPRTVESPSVTFQDLKHAGAGYAERLFALMALAVAGPVILLLAAFNRFSSKGPAFYSQVRVGKEGKNFQVWKLRTMVVGAESKTGPVLSWSGDPRVTAFGNFLRKSHLDELPQLWNVLCGEMSFLGPRPERPEFVREFSQNIRDYRLRHAVRPGITGLAQICCGYNATAEEKLKYDLIYIENRHSPRLMAFVLFRTVLKVVLQ